MIDATVSYAKKDQKIMKEDTEIRAVYLSYLEYLNHFTSGSKSINEKKIDNMIDNIKNDYFNTILLHVSPFSDAIYESKLFPYSYTLTGVEGKNPGFDYLAYFLKQCHSKKIKVYAWINPYRISFEKNKEVITKNNPAYKLLNTSSICIDNNGIYYNPSSEIVKNLILRQIEEIINQYDIDGIHLDDYFYLQKDVDKEEYEFYLVNGGKMSLKEFRLYHTNDLIKKIYQLIKKKRNDLVFSIAPDGNINNNYLYHYADVKTWLSNEDYLDIIMPQIYYGFENEYAPFHKVLDDWEKLITNKKIQMVPVLAFYKIGNLDNEAGLGKEEWLKEDLIPRQIETLEKQGLKGYAMFRYDYMYNKNTMNELSEKEIIKVHNINQRKVSNEKNNIKK